MTNATVRDILDLARDIHHRLSEYFQQLADTEERERIRMLLQYLQRHEEGMENYVNECESLVFDRVLETWYPYVPETNIQNEIQNADLSPTSSLSEIISAAVRLDNCLVNLYRRMADTATSEDVKHLFEELLRLEEKEEFRVVRDTFELADL